MTQVDSTELERRVLAHPYHQQETYQIDGTRYVLEKGSMMSGGRWQLCMYPESGWMKVEGGDSIKEVFEIVRRQGVPVEKLTLDMWHD